MTARSIKFCNSRMFPGQLYRTSASIVSGGIVSILLFIRRAYRFVKCQTSFGMSSVRCRKVGT